MWVYENAQNLIGQLPVRKNPLHGLYEIKPLKDITMLICHYTGDPQSGGSISGYGVVSPQAVAQYQITTDTELFPEIAYSFQIQPDGTVYQLHQLEKETWQACEANSYSRGILFTGFGRLGSPTENALKSFSLLAKSINKYLSRELFILGHKDVNRTDCPGDKWSEWREQIMTMIADVAPIVFPKPNVPGFEALGPYSWLCTLTGFSVEYRVLEMYKEKDGLFWLGYPRSNWQEEDGKLVQYFQRARLEVKPQYYVNGKVDSSVPWNEVFQLGLVGDELLRDKGILSG